MVCSFYHERKFSPLLSRITVIKDDKYGLDYPITCRQCNICPPIENCPNRALSRQGDVIHVDGQLCTGCGICVEICKFDAVKLDQESNPIICDLCDGDPQCVSRCPTGALGFVSREEFTERPEEAFKRLKEDWDLE
jgi:Fe-S-cluster-containing hydrogenase component 2